MDGFSRILEKKGGGLLCTRLYLQKNIKRKFQIEPSQPFYGSIFRQIEIEGKLKVATVDYNSI